MPDLSEARPTFKENDVQDSISFKNTQCTSPSAEFGYNFPLSRLSSVQLREETTFNFQMSTNEVLEESLVQHFPQVDSSGEKRLQDEQLAKGFGAQRSFGALVRTRLTDIVLH